PAAAASARTASTVTPAIVTRFCRPRSPLTIVIARRRTRSTDDRNSMRAVLAAPSTGGAAIRTTSAPSRSPANPVFAARGTTRISSCTPSVVEAIAAPGRAGRVNRRRLSRDLARTVCRLGVLGRSRAVDQDAFVAVAGILLADELERVAQGLDVGLDGRLDVLALQLGPVDLGVDVFEARLGPLEQQLRSALGLAHHALRFGVGGADDPPRFDVGGRLDVVGHLLRGHHRGAEVLLVFTVMIERRFHADEVLTDPIGLAQRLLVVVGHRGEK